MGYTIETVAENIILITLRSPFIPAVDLPALHLAAAAACATMRAPITRVVDMTEARFPISDSEHTLYEATRRRAGSLADPRFYTVYVVGENAAARQLVESLDREEYGDLHFEMVTTLDEALVLVGVA